MLSEYPCCKRVDFRVDWNWVGVSFEVVGRAFFGRWSGGSWKRRWPSARGGGRGWRMARWALAAVAKAPFAKAQRAAGVLGRIRGFRRRFGAGARGSTAGSGGAGRWPAGAACA